ncbi:hypothetical protein LEP1GSC161_2334 [Leptospira santarosai str. CBC1416]|uniref:Uncharacterized protein n=5 Tax=Leptospira santarosai TaxID=28183 RepID=M6URC7_9LEPT|nr:hypothetical protein LSS_22855 [Leptospira santarosai serovar Shermani str. LT 821]EKO33932.1 hypothetical protein LEP1GSC179_2069 [Leptospira santarosai str. MOR084]EKO79043.1 hypothetical protein LEP1GSC068_3913 [Leptospira sp. Fiocruz LV3954]EMF92379.1 hypothetical protein LEP1GSC005_0356 [Leptospira santarosai str. ST188]EMI67002.1 hypothetical protein LEP1GSC076_3988 [Leptospira sp. Fiocruz LV4135]EMM86798.1 hypothetical protein LEP1GSC039_3746 [Leptospira santarosai str. 2000027870]E
MNTFFGNSGFTGLYPWNDSKTFFKYFNSPLPKYQNSFLKTSK